VSISGSNLAPLEKGWWTGSRKKFAKHFGKNRTL
jgi:hypothetical protein